MHDTRRMITPAQPLLRVDFLPGDLRARERLVDTVALPALGFLRLAGLAAMVASLLEPTLLVNTLEPAFLLELILTADTRLAPPMRRMRR